MGRESGKVKIIFVLFAGKSGMTFSSLCPLSTRVSSRHFDFSIINVHSIKIRNQIRYLQNLLPCLKGTVIIASFQISLGKR